MDLKRIVKVCKMHRRCANDFQAQGGQKAERKVQRALSLWNELVCDRER